jgi:hypothetical protein
MLIWDRIMLHGSRTLLHAALSILSSCSKEMMEMDSLGTMLPYLQHVPVRKVERRSFQKALEGISKKTFEGLVRVAECKVEKERVAAASAVAARPARGAKRTRGKEDDENSFSSPLSKKVRGEIAIAVPPTPGVFRRIMDSLATPLRNRARMDGAQTPKTRPSQEASFWSRPRTRQTTEKERAAQSRARAPTFRKMKRVGRVAVASALVESPSAGYKGSPLGLRGSPLVAEDSPFGRSGILSPSYRGYMPARLAPLVSLDSPSQGKDFVLFAEATPRRESPFEGKAEQEKFELQPLKIR